MMRSKARRRQAGGFTLIEVLVALAIVSTVLVSIGAVIGVTIRGTRALDQHMALVEAARAIEAGLVDRTQLIPGHLTGELSGNRWRVDVLPFLGGAIDSNRSSPWIPQAVTITVTSPTGATLQIDTIRLHRNQPG